MPSGLRSRPGTAQERPEPFPPAPASQGDLNAFLRCLGLEGFEAALLEVTGLAPSLPEHVLHVEEKDLQLLQDPRFGMKPPQTKKLWASLREMREVYVQGAHLSTSAKRAAAADTSVCEVCAPLLSAQSSPRLELIMPSEPESRSLRLTPYAVCQTSARQAVGASAEGNDSGTGPSQTQVSQALKQVLEPDASAISYAVEARATALRERFLRARLLASAPPTLSGSSEKSAQRSRTRSVSACTPPRLRLRSRSRGRSHSQRYGHPHTEAEVMKRKSGRDLMQLHPRRHDTDSLGERGIARGGA